MFDLPNFVTPYQNQNYFFLVKKEKDVQESCQIFGTASTRQYHGFLLGHLFEWPSNAEFAEVIHQVIYLASLRGSSKSMSGNRQHLQKFFQS